MQFENINYYFHYNNYNGADHQYEEYVYTRDSLLMEECRSTYPSLPLPQSAQRITTPLNSGVWSAMLADHPDKQFANYILKGIEQGFRIDYHIDSPLQSAKHNMLSASQHQEIIDNYLKEECARGAI